MCPVPPVRRNRRCACAYRSRPLERGSSFFLSLLGSRWIRDLFNMHEGSALVHLRARIARSFPRQHFGGMGLGIVLRPVAEPNGVGIVVPAARVARDAVDDLETDAGMIDADRDELRQVARAEPDGEPALVDRRRVAVADADHEHLYAVLVGVETAERLADHFRHAVAAVRLRVDAMVDRLVAPVEADRVVAGGEHDTLHAVPAGRLEHVVAADDVRLEDPVPGPFDRVAAEADDGVDALGDAPPAGHLPDALAHDFSPLR